MAIRINRVYTRGGDRGETSLVGGQRVPKDSTRIETYGTVDELNAVIGLVRAANQTGPEAGRDRLEGILARIQNELFNLGSDLATLPEDRRAGQPVIETRHVESLESTLDELNEGLPELRSFVLPGGGLIVAFLHQARTVCRRAERIVVTLARQEPAGELALIYLNRLSDLLFVLGRWVTHTRGEAETLWEPEKT